MCHDLYLVEAMRRIVEERPWLCDDDERALRRVGDGLPQFLVEIRRKAIHVAKDDALLEHRNLVDRLAVARKLGTQGFLETLEAASAHGELARRPDLGLLDFANRLARAGHHAT